MFDNTSKVKSEVIMKKAECNKQLINKHQAYDLDDVTVNPLVYV